MVITSQLRHTSRPSQPVGSSTACGCFLHHMNTPQCVVTCGCMVAGTTLATGGEDGQVKVWSRNGMLRTTLANSDFPVYSVAWGTDSDQICYARGSQIVIHNLLADYFRGRCIIASMPTLVAKPGFHSSAFALVPKKDVLVHIDGRITHDPRGRLGERPHRH